MKSLSKILLIASFAFVVSHVEVSASYSKTDFSKHYPEVKAASFVTPVVFQMLDAYHNCQVIVIERNDNEVLVIRNENEAFVSAASNILPVAHGPPRSCYGLKKKSRCMSPVFLCIAFYILLL